MPEISGAAGAAAVVGAVPFSTPRAGWVEPFPLDICLENNGGGSGPSGSVRLTFFTAPRSAEVDAVRSGCSTAGDGNTPTVSRLGLYSVASDGDLTLVASTPNDTSLFSTVYPIKEFSTPYTLIQGDRYAVGSLYVGTGGTAPIYNGASTIAGSVFGTNNDTRLNGSISGQSDLPESPAYNTVGNTGSRFWFALRETE